MIAVTGPEGAVGKPLAAYAAPALHAAESKQMAKLAQTVDPFKRMSVAGLLSRQKWGQSNFSQTHRTNAESL
ncbi:MAG: hypothetical protein HY661_02955 [Betaproteobacteria bacterium]|nr:hypothetical protein [Betaproteobacteria bacterium]